MSSKPSLADVEHARLLVADEEGRVGRRVVVVEQLEEEAEAALGAPLRARAEKPAVRSPESSRFPQFGQMKNGTQRSLAMGRRPVRGPMPQKRRSRAPLGHRQPEVLEAALGHHAAARGALDQALLQQIRLVDVLDRVLLLVDRGRQRREPDRARRRT